MVSKEQLKAGLSATVAVAEAIRGLGSVPSGELYARVMTHLDLAAYTKVIGLLKGAGLVSESGHMLTWIGPEVRG